MSNGNRIRHWSLYLLFFALFSASCAVTSETAIDLPPLTLEPAPTTTFSGLCDERGVLEDWLQTVEFQQRDFVMLMRDGIDKSPDDLYLDVEQMARIRNRIAEDPVPDCAEDAFTSIMEAMEVVLRQFQSYTNGQAVDLSDVIQTVEPLITTFENQRDALITQLEGR